LTDLEWLIYTYVWLVESAVQGSCMEALKWQL